MANAPKETKAALPATLDASYPILSMAAEQLHAVIRSNIGNSRLTEFDVDRIKIPTGGGGAWMVPSLEGKPEPQIEIGGIVIHWKDPRAFWKILYDDSGGGTPPDCSSDDGINGIGEPSGVCDICPLAQFGSHHKGRAQACKQMRVLFVVREQEFLPISISCPPTSLDNMRKYFLRLAGRGIAFYHIITKFTLAQDRNKDGVEYSVVVPSMVRMLNDAEIEAVSRYRESIQPALQRTRLTPTASEFAG